MEGIDSRIKEPEEIDLVVFRENLEDLYMGIEFEEGSEDARSMRHFLQDRGAETRKDSGYSIKPISRTGSERLIRRAFEYAEEKGYETVTAVDKANVMKYTDGLFMDVSKKVAADYDVDYEHVLVDNMAQQLVMRPEEYGVIATQNIYGDILSDLAGGLVGGIGMIPSANIGEKAAVFASVHGTAPDIAGENKANPAAVTLSGAMLLEHAGKGEKANNLRRAVREVVAAGNHVTSDLGGDASTMEMAEAIMEAI